MACLNELFISGSWDSSIRVWRQLSRPPTQAPGLRRSDDSLSTGEIVDDFRDGFGDPSAGWECVITLDAHSGTIRYYSFILLSIQSFISLMFSDLCASAMTRS